jgi:hypothetical protein
LVAPALGDVFTDPASGGPADITNLSFWIAADSFPSADTLTLYFGAVSSGTTPISEVNGVTVSEVQSGYYTSGGNIYQYESTSASDAFYNIYYVTFSGLDLPLTAGDYYEWGVAAVLPTSSCATPSSSNYYCLDTTFAPLVSAYSNADDLGTVFLSYTGGTSMAGVYGSGPYTASGLNPAPAVDFVTNCPAGTCNVNFTVPEPSTIGLLAIGMGLVGLRVRRRK